MLRVNGYGSAWPVLLGEERTERAVTNLMEEPFRMANASVSLILMQEGQEVYHLLFDVGLGVVNSLLRARVLRKSFRPIDGIVLSHSHFDHIAGLDWLVNSLRRYPFPPPPNPARFPVYCTQGCWEIVTGQIFPWLKGFLDWKELKYGIPQEIPGGLTLLPLPVYHGPYAPGSTMVVVKYQGYRIILTGDFLAPLQPEHAWLYQADCVFIDSTTRFPSPTGWHISISDSKSLGDLHKITWRGVKDIEKRRADLEAPLRFLDRAKVAKTVGVSETSLPDLQALPSNGLELLGRWNPRKFYLTHYSGYEDQQLGQEILTDPELVRWARKEASARNIPDPERIEIATPGLEIVLR